jgi:microcystin-dependent protein
MSSIPDPATTAWVPLWDTGAAGAAAFGSIPGEIKMWSGTVLPDPAKYGKWVWADGAVYDTVTYPEASANIAAAWKTAHGAADPGAGKFRAPDMRGVNAMGMDAMPGGTRANRTARAVAITLAARTGEEYHTLTLAEMASHAHTGATGGWSADHSHSGSTGTVSADHGHNVYTAHGGGNTSSAGGGIGVPDTYGLNVTTGGINTNHTHAFTTGGASTNHTHGITAEGGGGAHENLPPTIFVPYIVRLDG